MLSNQEILEKALQKAKKNGWDWPSNDKEFNAEAIIFNHDFAKALWPEGRCTCDSIHKPHSVLHVTSTGETHIGLDDWRQHLQQMVIADDPIEYLGENI